MSTMSSPVTKMAKLSSQTQISDYADADLSAIFQRLPPTDRLIASEVSRRWFALSRKEWLDITELDLSPIRGKHIGAIVSQCSNLRSVFALKKSFDVNELAILSKSSLLSSVKLYDCKFSVKSDPDPNVINDGFAKIFSVNLQHTFWSELILHNARIQDVTLHSIGIPHFRAVVSSASDSESPPEWAFSAAYLPVSLTRLQLSGLRITKGMECDSESFLTKLERLQNLECLILYETRDSWTSSNSDEFEVVSVRSPLFKRLYALKNLKELCVKPAMPIIHHSHEHLAATLSKLQVLFLDGLSQRYYGNNLGKLITKNSSLRILVFSGEFHESNSSPHPIRIRPRKRFPNGFGSDPLPLLHVFVGRQASEQLHFNEPSSDAAAFYPINQPMPKFLEREDIARIFEGVWVAEQIKEMAKIGGRLWNYELCDRATSMNAVSFKNAFSLPVFKMVDSLFS